jgi:hypothetical protein
MDKQEETKLQTKIDKLKQEKIKVDDNEELKKQVKDLTQKVEELTNKRIKQQDILPGAVKQRHINEGVMFIRSGPSSDLPVAGEGTANGSAFYYDYDTDILYIWDGTQWQNH